MEEVANGKRSMEPSLKEGDKVYLLRKNIKTKRPNSKLDFKRLGPFRILKKISNVNFEIKLPTKSKLHLVFHILLLEKAPDYVPKATNTNIQPENEPDIYDVEKVLDKRVSLKKTEYLVK